MAVVEKTSKAYEENPAFWRQVILVSAASVASINAIGLIFGSLTKIEMINNIILAVTGIAGQTFMFGSRFFVNDFLQNSVEIRDREAFIFGHRISVKSKLEKALKKIGVLFFVRVLLFYGIFFQIIKFQLL